jgi:hypothetical protein
MSYLVYCIFHSPLRSNLEIPAGVGGQRVFTVNYKGFAAALSKLVWPNSPPDVSNLLEYETVIESFYRRLTVIPMRYGCRVECPTEAIGLLGKNHQAYGALLRELEGLAEMGIQVLLGNPRARTENAWAALPPESLPPHSSASGTAYLEAKKLNFLSPDRATTLQNAFVEKLCDSLYGFFVRHKVEFPSSLGSRLLSLYFLVRRDAVESFRQAARRLQLEESLQLLLTGPWPPYNFVNSYERQTAFQGVPENLASQEQPTTH